MQQVKVEAKEFYLSSSKVKQPSRVGVPPRFVWDDSVLADEAREGKLLRLHIDKARNNSNPL